MHNPFAYCFCSFVLRLAYATHRRQSHYHITKPLSHYNTRSSVSPSRISSAHSSGAFNSSVASHRATRTQKCLPRLFRCHVPRTSRPAARRHFLLSEGADKDETRPAERRRWYGIAPVCRESKVQERRQRSRRPRDSGLMSCAACVSANAHDAHEYMHAYTHSPNICESDIVRTH